MIIGIVGSIASGKDTVADYLVEKKGFQSISLSDILREEMKKMGEEITVENMTRIGNDLRINKGNGYLTKLALEKINKENVIITSIRQVGEVETLRGESDFVLVKLDAPIDIRFERLQKRKRFGDVASLEELRRVEYAQASGAKGAMNMNECFKMADKELTNEGTYEELYDKVEKLLKEINV